MEQQQILIPAQLPGFTSRFLIIVQHLLPATIQAQGLQSDETVTLNSVASFATGLFSLSANPSGGDIVTIGPRTYIFDTLLNPGNGNIQIGPTAADSIEHLIAAINLGPGAGLDYSQDTTENTDVSATEAPIASQMSVISKVFGEAGNTIQTIATNNGSWATPTLVAGTVSVSESGSPVELTETNNTLAINSPLRIQAVKGVTVGPVSVSVAYGNKV